ncbi:UPF0481 protein At3g47200-like isoform X2 [Salvia miltiorrhiza]|uniref:UPF0481 protein At3g47200-like isoform X2 n=1 Tax=Salvia miltiorrhiza TaxID=226208 RepID=UPI0025ABF13D|nr:UPF0481 protein At3g47200-like isoform X2 [Salvia miltiorrhiza]
MRSQNQEMKSDQAGVNVDNKESKAQLIEIIISSFDQKLDKLSVDPSYSYAACIYRVSEKLRKANEGAYTPRLVSIGPLHHDIAQLQGMEASKLKFMHNFLSRFGIGMHTLVKFAAKEESFVRGCYEGKVDLSVKQLTEVILLDGIFIVELFLQSYFSQLRDKNETVFENQWIHNNLLHDMLLLENQLPIRIMKSLMSFVDLSFLNEGTMLTIYDLAHSFFKNVGNTHKVPLTARCNNARHFVEFLLILHAPTEKRVLSTEKMRKNPSPTRKFEYSRSATELQEAGVTFRGGKGDCLLEVSFPLVDGEGGCLFKLLCEQGGVLTIPKLRVDELSETFFRNLVAFEQLGHFGYFSKYITSYVILMDSFIDTSSDVELLEHHGIIENKLGNSQQVADLFNHLHKEVVTEANDFYFAELCGDLNDYSKDWLHQWKASWFRSKVALRKNYFSSPWSSLSVAAATVLLILTVIQTVCSILQV